MKIKNFFSLLIFLAIVFSIQWIGSILTLSSVGDWYLTLNKPTWNPPPWIFGFVWTILYLSIAISGWLIYSKTPSSKKKTLALSIYGVQLFFNLTWTYCFFFLKNPALALADLLLLLTLIFINIHLFLKLYRPSGLLLIPYFIWSLFAALLNLTLLILNPQ
jgi:benzodiazapine receptor